MQESAFGRTAFRIIRRLRRFHRLGKLKTQLKTEEEPSRVSKPKAALFLCHISLLTINMLSEHDSRIRPSSLAKPRGRVGCNNASTPGLRCARSSSSEHALRGGLPANGPAGSLVVRPTTELPQVDLQRSNGHCTTRHVGEPSHCVT